MATEAQTFRVRVHLFARAKELAGGASFVDAELALGSTVGQARKALAAQVPSLAELLESASTALARNSDFADDADALEDGDELAVLPPSAVDDPRAAAVSVRVTGDPLDAGAAIAAVTRPHAGGIGVFVGTTRDSFNGREVTRLEYEAFTPLAERALARIGQAAARRYGLAAVAVWHRVGVVGVGEVSVVIATSATHRREAMEAAAAVIAAVKARAPIWKQEWYAGDDRAWKENCECAHALPSVPAAALRGEGDHIDVAAWLGEQSPADVARVGSAAGSAHRPVEPAAAPAAAAPAAAVAPGLSEA